MRIKLLAATTLGLAVLVAACSGAGATTAPTTAPTAAPTEAPSVEAPASPAAGGAASVALADNALGKIVVDGTGKTLYVFTPDGTTSKSTCTGDCAGNWPAFVSTGAPTLGTGLDAEDFTSFTRDDGGAQVVFYGMPLYHFAGDKAAGDTNGQGLGGKWYVVGADGKMIK
jgi:predicted lipoprotein with Yx(FWY)xxD motif